MSTLLRLSQASKAYSLSVSSIKRLIRSGKLPPTAYVRTQGGHIRLIRGEVEKAWGIPSTEANQNGNSPNGVPRIAIAARVSSPQQDKKNKEGASSLDRQVEELKTEVVTRWGEAALAQADTYKRISSGLNYKNPVLISLIENILKGKYDYVVARDRIRIMRFANEIFSLVCKHGGAEIIYTNSVDAEDAKEDMTISILSVITHFSSRFHGERNGTLNGFHVEEKTTEYIYRLAVEKKLSSRRIAKLLEEKGIRGKVKGKECTIKWFHIDRLLERITPNMNKLLGSKDKNNFTMFAKENII